MTGWNSLTGKTVAKVEQRKWKVVIEFEDGTRAHMHHGGGQMPGIEPTDE